MSNGKPPNQVWSGFTRSAPLAEHLRRPQIVLMVLSAFTFIVYSATLSFQFVWDDFSLIRDNPVVRSWRNVPQAFVSDLWSHVHRTEPLSMVPTLRGPLYYRPLFTTWSILNYSLFHLRPWGWHLAAVLLHVAGACLVYLLAKKLGLSYWTAVLAAALFALHPIHIECVAWISAASDTMVTIFCLLAMVTFVRSREDSSRLVAWRAVSIFMLVCALLTKEMAVSFFAVIALYVWLFPSLAYANDLRARMREVFAAAFPYALVTLGYLVLRKYAMHAVGISRGHHTISELVLTLPYVLTCYLRLLLFPSGLTGLYYTPYLHWSDLARVLLSILVLVGLAGAIWYWRRRTGDHTVTFLGLWVLVTLAPALYLFNFANGDFVRDRYAYLPSVGFIVLGAKAIRLLPRLGRFSGGVVQSMAAVVVIAGFVTGAAQQFYWANEFLLFQRGHDLYPHNVAATVGLAGVMQRSGNNEGALLLLKQATAQDPIYLPAYIVMAEAYSGLGNNEAARQALLRAMALAPEPFMADVEVADLAGLFARLGDYDRALQLCSPRVRKSPELLSLLYNCGNAYFMAGRYADAERLLAHAVEVAPGEPGPTYWLGRVSLQSGHTERAVAAFKQSIAINDVYEGHYWLAQSLEKAGDWSQAREQYEQALRLNPDSSDARLHLERLKTNPQRQAP